MSNFLEANINDSFLDTKLRFVQSELEENLNELLADVKQKVEEDKPRPFKIIKPDPGMCVKAYRVTNNEKIFINICTSDGIPAPEDISADQLTEILSSETPSNYKIPMSITELRLIPDKSGKDAVACDVAVHPNFFRKLEALRVFREFLITIVFEALDTKYNVQVNRDTWIVLKNRKCMGSLVKHRVQNRDVQKVVESYQNPTKEHKTLINELKSGEQIEYKETNSNLITEISTKRGASNENDKMSSANLTKINAQNNNSRKPDYRLYKTNELASQLLVAEFFLPEVIDATDFLLDLNADRMVLESRRFGYLFDSFVPNYIDVNASTAEFNNVHRITVETLSSHLNELLTNKSYYNRAKEISRHFNDNLVHPMEEAGLNMLFDRAMERNI